jgi:hypothetical protein
VPRSFCSYLWLRVSEPNPSICRELDIFEPWRVSFLIRTVLFRLTFGPLFGFI